MSSKEVWEAISYREGWVVNSNWIDKYRVSNSIIRENIFWDAFLSSAGAGILV
jgi:hypothetical protein